MLRCTHIGTLPVCVRDQGGTWRSLEIPNVRYARQGDSLLSVDQLWEDLNLDVAFRNVRCVVAPHGTHFPSDGGGFLRTAERASIARPEHGAEATAHALSRSHA